MANELAHDLMCSLWEKAAKTTGMKMTLSRDLDTWQMGGDSNSDNGADSTDNSNGTGNDREYIPQEYRFDVQDGIESSDSDFQDLVDRMIPINRGKSKRVLASIDAKGLRNPARRKKVADGFARDLANAIDLACYQTMINSASMVIQNTGAFEWQNGIDAEVLMLNRGYGGYDKKMFLANKDYGLVAKDLGQASRDTLVNDAISRAKVPDLATFDTMRSDYLVSLPASSASGVTVNGAQEHTVSTYDSNDFYLDNRSMSLSLTGATAGNMPVGTKFTIAGVNFLHPETRVDSGELLTFTVETAGTTPVIKPALVATGPYRNASAAAANSAAVTVLNIAASNPTLFYTPESTVLVPGNLPIPSDGAGVTSIEATTEQGLPMRMSYWYDPHKETFNMKALVFFDVQVIYPDQVGAILSNQT